MDCARIVFIKRIFSKTPTTLINFREKAFPHRSRKIDTLVKHFKLASQTISVKMFD